MVFLLMIFGTRTFVAGLDDVAQGFVLRSYVLIIDCNRRQIIIIFIHSDLNRLLTVMLL